MLVDTEETPESALEREDILHTGEGGRLSTRGGLILDDARAHAFLLENQTRQSR
jgi:hypothetical protein